MINIDQIIDNMQIIMDAYCESNKQWCADASGNCDCDNCEVLTTINMASKALKEKEKYKWHDLRKDPNDVPDCDDMVYVYGHQCTGEIDYMMDQYLGEYGWQCSEIGEIIAWRYIEPFEGKNNEFQV